MTTYRDLDVLDAADLIADDVNRLLDAGRGHVIHPAQLRDCVGSIGANIAEGMTRRTLEGRNSCLDTSRGEANEAIRHLLGYSATRPRGRATERPSSRLQRLPNDDNRFQPRRVAATATPP